MFQPGDKLTYTGKFRNACNFVSHDEAAYGKRDEWIYVSGLERLKAGEKIPASAVIYAYNPTGDVYSKSGGEHCAFHYGDMELGFTGPEVYEEWFK